MEAHENVEMCVLINAMEKIVENMIFECDLFLTTIYWLVMKT
jgi:hypothetical protein